MNKIYIFLLINIFFLNLEGIAQTFSDDFSDGDFTNNPVWTGNTENFEVLNGELHLFHQEPEDNNESVLVSAVAQQVGVATTWEFDFRLEFDPSSSNRARVYLQADNADLAGNLNGYYIQLGESGSEDAIKLYKQSGSSSDLLIEGTAGDIAVEPSAKVRVTRSENNEWELFYDVDGSGYNSYGTATDNEFSSGNYMGIWCDYIASRAELFYFDNFLVNPIYIDTDAPELTSTVVVSGNQVALFFNETLNESSVVDLDNFSLSGVSPLSATLSENGTSIVLVFANNFTEGATQNLNFTVSDLVGNPLSGTTNFSYNPTKAFDVLITEIMADPTPTVALPEQEYIELYNRSENAINLKDWQLLDGSGDITLPDYELAAGAYITLAEGSFAFDAAGINYIDVNLPSLTNDGELLQLLDNTGKLIFSIEYDDAWHNGNKDEGGWSLEMISPNNPCGESDNWASSVANKGGTPSAENSIFDITLVDGTAPELVRVAYVNEASIVAHFNEKIDISKLSAENFSIDNNIGTPLIITAISPENKSVSLSLNALLQEQTVYTLTVSNICDCVGNVVGSGNFAQFAIPVSASAGDIIINEILFEQATGNTDYVEIYNNSDKIIDLENYSFTRDGYAQVENEIVYENEPAITKISEASYLLFPEQYLVLTADQNLVKQQYLTENENAFLDVDGFPTLDSSQDAIFIKDSLGTTIDQVLYTDDWHYSLIDNEKGVSLERVRFDGDSQDASNWHSASGSVGYGTPGYLNSQFFALPELEESFTLSPETFSPDGDAYNDFLLLNYELDEAGYTMNAHVFDDRGRPIKHFVQNELLGRTGSFKWDGENENNEKVNIGIYIIYIEIFNLEGKVERFKRTCTVAGQLK